MNIDNDELAKDIFVFSKDQNYKNSKKLKYQRIISSRIILIHDRRTANKYHITQRSISYNECNNLE